MGPTMSVMAVQIKTNPTLMKITNSMTINPPAAGVLMKAVASSSRGGENLSDTLNYVKFIALWMCGWLTDLDADVTCSEVCVYCFKHFMRVSTYMKHIKTHKDANNRKSRYMLGTCDDLREQATFELDRMLGRIKSSSDGGGNMPAKRVLGMADLGAGTPQSPKRVKTNLDGTNVASVSTIEQGRHGVLIIFLVNLSFRF